MANSHLVSSIPSALTRAALVIGAAALAALPALAEEAPSRVAFREAAGGWALEAGGALLEVRYGAVRFGAGGATDVGFALEGLSLGGATAALGGCETALEGPRRLVRTYGRDLEEIYEPRPGGIEQIFVVRALPGRATGDDLVLSARLSTGLLPEIRKDGGRDGVVFVDGASGREVVRIGEAIAVDATGARTDGRMAVAGGRMEIALDGAWVAAATLPITIDPLIGGPISVSTATSVEGATDVACSVASRAYTVVYEELVAATGKRRIMAGRRDAATGASLDPAGAPRVVTESATIDAASPKVAWLGSGLDTVLVAWIADGTAIRGATISGATGVITTLATPLATLAAGETTMTALALGGRDQAVTNALFALVYEVAAGTGGADRNLKAVRVDATGALVGTVATVANTTLIERQPAINRLALGTNNWVIAWSEQTAAGQPSYNVRTRTLSQTGTLGTAQTPLGALAAPDETSREAPSIAGCLAPFVLAYENVHSSGLRGIRGALISAGGQLNNSIRRVVTTPGAFSDGAPSVASSATVSNFKSQDYLLAFTRTDTATGAKDVHAVRLDGNALLDVEPLAALTIDGKSSAPATIARVDPTLADREYAVAYESGIGAGPDRDPRLQRLGGHLVGEIAVFEGQLAGPGISNGAPAAAGRWFPALPTTVTAGKTVTIVVQNPGGGVLTRSSLPTSSDPDFIVDASALPATIAPLGGTGSFTVTFRPRTAGQRAATVSFVHDGSPGGAPATFTFGVKGFGVSGATPSATRQATPGEAILGTPGLSSAIYVPAIGDVVGLSARVDVKHPDTRRLRLFLKGPQGQEVLLSSQNPKVVGFPAVDYVATVFDETAAAPIGLTGAPFTGRFVPEEPFGNLYGKPAHGFWTLRILDLDAAPTGPRGQLVSWALTVDADPASAAVAGLRVSEGSAAGPALVHNDAPAGARASGPVVTGAGKSATFFVTNDGSALLTLGAATSSSPTEFAVTSAGAILAPGASTSFTVTFDPTATGPRSATVSFTHSSLAFTTPFVVRLSGYGLSQAAPPPAQFFATGAVTIDRSLGTTFTSPLQVNLFGEVLSVTVTGIDIAYPLADDLKITLKGPTGTAVILANRRGLGGADFAGARFDDAAPTSIIGQAAPFTGTYRPEEPLSRFIGSQANGTWTLEVVTSAPLTSGAGGRIDDWSIAIASTLSAPAAPALRVDDLTSGRSVAAGAPAAQARDFGHRQVNGPTLPVRIRVKNVGTGLMNVDTPAASGPGASDFTVSFAPQAFPAQVPVGGTVDFDVAFAPGSPGLKEATISFAHDAPASPAPFTFQVRGLATAAAPVVALGTGVPLAIPDLAAVRSSVTLTAAGVVADVDVVVDIVHSYAGSLEIALVAPDGTRVLLANRNGGPGNDFRSTRFDDAAAVAVGQGLAPFAGTFRPSTPLAALAGRAIAGTWTLEIDDRIGGDVGVLRSWSLDIAAAPALYPILEVREGSPTGPLVVSGAKPFGRRAFGKQVVALASPAQTFFVRNVGPVATTLAPLASVGANPGDFVVDASGLASPLLPGDTASFTVAFTPGAAGARSAEVRFAHDAIYDTTAPFHLPVSGVGVAAFASPGPETLASPEVPLALPNNDSTGASATVLVNLPGSVSDVDARISIAHPNVQDLDVFLVGPDGTQVALVRGELFAAPRLNFTETVFNDGAATAISSGTAPFTGAFKPVELLSAFNARPAAGLWTLLVLDRNPGNVGGPIAKFELIVTATPTPTQRIEVREGGVVVAASSTRDLGNAAAGGTGRALTYRLENPSLATLSIASVALTGTNAADFAITPSIALPANLPPGGSMTVEVALAPASAGRKSATLEVAHGGLAGPATPFRVFLAGGASEGASRFASADVPKSAGDFATARSTLAIAPSAGILDVNVEVDIRHRRAADLVLALIAPDGTRVALKGSAFNLHPGVDLTGTTFDDEAATALSAAPGSAAPFRASYKPVSPLSALAGKDMTGTWTLEMSDQGLNFEGGTITGWTLDIGHATGFYPLIEVRDRGAAGPAMTSGAAPGGVRHVNRQTTGVTTAPVALTIRNPGTAPLTLGAPAITGTNAADFAIAAAPAVTLAPQAETTLAFTFTPGGTGTRTATIELPNDGRGAANPFLIPVSGFGATLSTVETLASPDTGGAIPDGAGTNDPFTPPERLALGALRAVIVSNLTGVADDVNVIVSVTHAQSRNLDLTLIGPDGASVLLASNRPGGIPTNATFDDTGAIVPLQPLATFKNRPLAGVWTLVVEDKIAGATGTLTRFDLVLARAATAAPAIELREGGPAGPAIAQNAVPGGARIFPPTQKGTASAPLAVAVLNPGTVPLTISAATTSAADFAVAAPPAVAAGASETMQVTYVPGSAGKHIATVSLTHDATGSSIPATFQVRGRAFHTTPIHLVAAGTPMAIPDVRLTGAILDVPHVSTERIVDVVAKVRIEHPRTGDLNLYLIAPDGTEVKLGTRVAGTSFAIGAAERSFDDLGDPLVGNEPGYYVPQEPLAKLYGRPAGGTWRLHVNDTEGGNEGRVALFELYIATAPSFPTITVREGSASGPAIAAGAAADGRRLMGAQTLGAPATPLDIVVQNAGPASLSLSGLQASGDFSVSLAGFAPTIPAGGSVSVQVIFQPTGLGPRAGTVSFAHDDPFSAPTPFTFAVLGEGVSAFANPATTSVQTPLTIPVSTLAGVRSEILLNAPGFVTSVRVLNLTLRHDNVTSVDLFLVAPDGTRVDLSSGNGAALTGSGYVGTSFDDGAVASILSATVPFAGAFRPEQPLAALQGRGATGVWALLVANRSGGFAGTLSRWDLEVTTSASAPAILEVAGPAGAVANGGTHAFLSRPIADGASAPEVFTLRNAGGAAITLGRPAKSGAGASEFILNTAAFGPTTTLAPGATISFEVAFDPASVGGKSAEVTFTHTAPGTTPFALRVAGVGLLKPATTYVATGLPVATADPSVSGISATTTSTIAIPPPATGALAVLDVNVTLTIAHQAAGDLDVYLISPAGTRVELTTDNGGFGDDYAGTTFDDQAATGVAAGAPPFSGTFRPEGSLAALFGEDGVGVWTLEVSDDTLGQSGTIVAGSLALESSPTPIARIALNEGAAGGPAVANGTGFPVHCGTAVLGLPVVKRIHVSNAGAGTLTIQRPAIGGANPTDFDVAGAFPLVVAGGGSAFFDVLLSPAVTGPVAASIDVDHDAAAFTPSPFRFDVVGRGAEIAPAAGAATGLPLAIPDATAAGPGRVDVPIAVASPGPIEYVVARVSISHQRDDDLDLTLIHPSGAQIELSTDNGGAGDDYAGTTFDELGAPAVTSGAAPFAGRFQPEQGFGGLGGLRASGTWILRIGDDEPGFAGSVSAVSLEVGVARAPAIEVRETSAAGPVIAHLQPAAGALAFGNLRLQAAAVVAPVVVRNIGTLPLSVTSVQLTANGGGAFALDTSAFGGTIAAGGSSAFSVRFDPTTVGAFAGTVSLVHTDATFPSPFRFDVSGTGTEAAIEVFVGGAQVASGDTIAFGAVFSGATADRLVAIRNTGTSALTASPTISGGSASSFILDLAGLPPTIAPGASGSFTVRFAPTSVGAKSAVLSITHDGAGMPTPVRLDLSGTSPGRLTTTASGGGGGGGGCRAGGPGAADTTTAALLPLALALAVLGRVRRRGAAARS